MTKTMLMGKLRNLLLTAAGVAMFYACAKEELRTPQAADTPAPTRSHLISMDSLQRRATTLPGLFSENPATRSAGKMIKEVLPLSDFLDTPATRSGSAAADPTENIYVVNYEDDEGFAILSADTRLEEVLAYSDQGNLTDTLSNPGLKMFIANIPDYAAEHISMAMDSFDPGFETYQEELMYARQIETTKGPYLTTRWHQESPFNNEVPTNCTGGKAPAGCVTIAIIQIMAHHGYPFLYNCGSETYAVNWSLYKTYTTGGNFPPEHKFAIAKFVYHIGHIVDTDYGCDESGSNINRADNGFKDIGYLTDGIYSYHIDRIRQDIDNGLPLYARGETSGGGGHAWVIDGYKSFHTIHRVYHHYYDGWGNFLRTEDKGERSGETIYWVHCNWGWWNGIGNGYYASGVFAPSLYKQLDEEVFASGSTDHYRIKMEIIKNIRR